MYRTSVQRLRWGRGCETEEMGRLGGLSEVPCASHRPMTLPSSPLLPSPSHRLHRLSSSADQHLDGCSRTMSIAAVDSTDLPRDPPLSRPASPASTSPSSSIPSHDPPTVNTTQSASAIPHTTSEDAVLPAHSASLLHSLPLLPSLTCPSRDPPFFKGISWSPDATCLLTNAEDHVMRLYEVQSIVSTPSSSASTSPVLSVNVGECIYDSCWYPLMQSTAPSTCGFLTTARDHPIQLWDAFTGEPRVSEDHLPNTSASGLRHATHTQMGRLCCWVDVGCGRC